MKQINLITLIFLIIPFAVYTQSVEEFISMAKNYNPGLKAIKLQYEAALKKADQVNSWPDPMVNLAVGVLPIETRLGAQRFKIGASQAVPWKGLLDAKSAVANSEAEIISKNDDLKAIDIEYAIRTSYNKLIFLEEQKAIINQKQLVLNALGEMAKSAVRSGKGMLSDVLLVERNKEILKSDMLLIAKKIEQPTIVINRWTGRDLSAEIEIVQNADNTLNLDQNFDPNFKKHPQFKVYENKINASKSKINLTRFQSKPKMSFGLDYAYIDARDDVNIVGNGRDVLMPMGSISIPINTGKYRAIRQEEAIKQEAIKEIENETLDLYKSEIKLAQSQIEYAIQMKQKFESLKNITEETIQLMHTEYASEGTRFEELLKLEMELVAYDFEILNAEYQKNMAISTLLKYK